MRKLATWILLAVAACGGSSSVSIEDYPSEMEDAICDFAVKCDLVKDSATCHETNLNFDLRLSASELEAVTSGRAKYDGKKAQACADAFRDRSCDTTSESFRVASTACAAIITGTLAEGATCAVDGECQSQFCDIQACDMACCTGACVGGAVPGLAKIGESCEVIDCEAGAYCDRVASTCTAVKGAGASCLGSDECTYGFDCILPEGTCGSLPELGASCTGACRDTGATCNQTSHTCVKVALEGAACTTSSDCSFLYTCNAQKQCSRGIATGEPCTISQRCADRGAFCDTPALESMGICALPKADGATCRFNADCESGVCDPQTDKCIADVACL